MKKFIVCYYTLLLVVLSPVIIVAAGVIYNAVYEHDRTHIQY